MTNGLILLTAGIVLGCLCEPDIPLWLKRILYVVFIVFGILLGALGVFRV